MSEPEEAISPTAPPEPEPFTAEEFAAWRGMLRVHSTILRELDRALLEAHGFGIDSYGVLITLVTAGDHRLPIGELGMRRNLTPSGISRSVDRLTKLDLLERVSNPDDGRSFLVGLTSTGLRRLRESQVTHHRVVRDLLLAPLDEDDVKRLGELWEKAMPGAVTSPDWPL